MLKLNGTKVLIHPGLYGSGPTHWQSLWQASHPGFIRVQQRDWDNPVCAEWVATLEHYVAEAGTQTVVVAHSLGCHTLAHWAAHTCLGIKGAMLVAPPDVAAPGCPPQVQGYVPVSRQRLPFPSLVVASSDDPHGSVEYARDCAATWGSQLEIAGPLGHINEQSDIGEWPAGYACLQRLL